MSSWFFYRPDIFLLENNVSSSSVEPTTSDPRHALPIFYALTIQFDLARLEFLK